MRRRDSILHVVCTKQGLFAPKLEACSFLSPVLAGDDKRGLPLRVGVVDAEALGPVWPLAHHRSLEYQLD